MAAGGMHIPEIVTTDFTSDNDDGNRLAGNNREDTQDASSGSSSLPHTYGSDNSSNLNPGVVVEDTSLSQPPSTTNSERERERPPTPHIEIQSTPPAPASPSLSPSPSHSRSPSTAGATDPNFLTPILKPPARPTLEVPSNLSPGGASPHSASSETSSHFPPSPTLSTRSSVHFQQPTTLALRDNVVDGRSGMESLNMLQGHERKISSATTEGSFVISESGDTDPDPHYPPPPLSANGESREHGGTKGRSFSIGTTATTAMSLGAPSDGATISPTVTHVDDASSAHPHKIRQKPTKKPTTSTENDIAPVEHLNPELDTTDPSPFTFKPLHLASLVDPKSLEVLQKMGGVDAVLQSLGTDPIKGLPSSAFTGGLPSEKSEKGGVDHEFTLEDRKRVYGTNVVPTRKSKSLLLLMWLALKDKILIMLSIAAAVSLALGLFQDFGTKPETISCAGPNGTVVQCQLPKVDWVEGVAIIIAIIIVDVVGSVNDWQKERQFRQLNEQKEDRTIKVMRAGKERLINVKEVLVGDICLLEPGEIIPVDGIFLRGHAVKCDESGATGESDAIRKVPYSMMIEREEDDIHEHEDCFLVSGSKVQEGVGEYVAIAVGTRSFNGRIMMALRGEAEETPLQGKLNNIAEMIAKLGTAAGIILFASLMIRFFVQLKTEAQRTPSEKALAFVNILVISFTIVVVAVPEGLPLAVTLALAFATKRMTRENLLVRVLGSCETMANASVVCTDKTGTLTQNEMSVVAGSLGIHAKFVRRLKDNRARTNAGEGEGEKERKHRNDFSIDQANLNRILPPPLKKLFNESIALNSTAFEDKDPTTGKVEFVGSKTETSLLTFARELEWENYQVCRDNAEVVQMIPFSSERKCMGIVVKLGEKRWRVYLKGASEILTKRCTRHVVVKKEGSGEVQHSSDDDEIETRKIDKLGEENISRTIIFYANQMLRTIALCYRDLDDYPSFGEELPYDQLARDMTLIAITGIEDPLREGVREAVANCHRAGVAVKMCTGDNVLTARSIASQCGIFTPGGIVMEGPVFRTLDDHDMKEILPRLQVLARSSPEDKKILVERLKEMGEIVGVTGDGTNDGPALKSAHVGFSMGIAGTEIAKEASDIILMDDNFASIVSAIMWGRCVNDAVRKFLQFQISVNITAVLITYVTAVASAQEQSVLSAVQLLWINIIMDTFAALALATDPASTALLERKPARKTAPLFNVDMCKQIAGQATYQTIIVLVFHFLGPRIFHEASGNLTDLEKLNQDTALQAFVFNAFVFCQIFNSINCRRLDNKLNVFEGIFKNYYFLIITTLEVVIQILVIFFGDSVFQVKPISGTQWGVSLAIGFISLPLGAALRRIPNEPVERFLVKIKFMRDPTVLPTTDPTRVKGDWNSAIDTVRDNLNTFAHVRGGRMRSSSIVRRSRIVRPKDVALPSLMTMVPTIVATSVAGRWGQGSLSDPAHVDPSVSSAALWEGKIQFHPETAKDDPAFKRWGGENSV